ncbi:MAG TPA: hypothetical protein VK087_02440 [Tissierellaceae bacterium]|nr:hypothetical protein [Tissierellaceae bacterium]
MYTEEEVFKELQKFLNNSDKEIDSAYKIHRKLVDLIPKEIRKESYFRYLELGGTIGLNVKNYRIYEYSYDKKEAFRIIYPSEDIENLRKVNLEPNVNFKFVSTPSVLLEVQVDEFKEFKDEQWDSFKKAVEIAFQGKDNPVGNMSNINIIW